MERSYRTIISPQARTDLRSIFAFIAQDSPANARKTVERLLDAIGTLNTFPHRSVVHDPEARLPHPVPMLPVRPYIVYFRVLENESVVRILTIRHGARRRPRRL